MYTKLRNQKEKEDEIKREDLCAKEFNKNELQTEGKEHERGRDQVYTLLSEGGRYKLALDKEERT